MMQAPQDPFGVSGMGIVSLTVPGLALTWPLFECLLLQVFYTYHQLILNSNVFYVTFVFQNFKIKNLKRREVIHLSLDHIVKLMPGSLALEPNELTIMFSCFRRRKLVTALYQVTRPR